MKLDNEIAKAVRAYQCPGCVCGSDTSCYSRGQFGIGCGKHVAGTMASGIGRIFLGMPPGFDRLGPVEHMSIAIYKSFGDKEAYDDLNIPIWKAVRNGHTFVKGYRPRINQPFLDVFLEDCSSKINCREIKQGEISSSGEFK